MHLVEVQSLDIYARRILILYRAINERNGLTRNIVGGRLWCACLHVIRITIGKKKQLQQIKMFLYKLQTNQYTTLANTNITNHIIINMSQLLPEIITFECKTCKNLIIITN